MSQEMPNINNEVIVPEAEVIEPAEEAQEGQAETALSPEVIKSRFAAVMTELAPEIGALMRMDSDFGEKGLLAEMIAGNWAELYGDVYVTMDNPSGSKWELGVWAEKPVLHGKPNRDFEPPKYTYDRFQDAPPVSFLAKGQIDGYYLGVTDDGPLILNQVGGTKKPAGEKLEVVEKIENLTKKSLGYKTREGSVLYHYRKRTESIV